MCRFEGQAFNAACETEAGASIQASKPRLLNTNEIGARAASPTVDVLHINTCPAKGPLQLKGNKKGRDGPFICCAFCAGWLVS